MSGHHLQREGEAVGRIASAAETTKKAKQLTDNAEAHDLLQKAESILREAEKVVRKWWEDERAADEEQDK